MNRNNLATPEHYLVIDLEATCNNFPKLPRERTEIIEIGAVLLSHDTLAVVGEFQTFVRPTLHSALSTFCSELTTIRQEEVDRAPTFPDALLQLRQFLEGKSALFCSWGEYDKNQFLRDSTRWRVTLPFDDGHFNAKLAFGERLGESRRYGLGEALRRLGLKFNGTMHRGIDDARNIARLMPFLLGQTQCISAT